MYGSSSQLHGTENEVWRQWSTCSSWVHYHLATHECLGNLDLEGRFRNIGSLIGLHHHLGSGKETAVPEWDQVQKVVVFWDEGVACQGIPDLEYPNLISFPWLKVVFIE